VKPSDPRQAPREPKARCRPGPVRSRAPRQPRGWKRVAGILDAAEEIIAEIGVDATTTTAIAARAKASVGSLYYFFKGKAAIIEALAQRFAALSCTVTTAAARDDEDRPLRRVVLDLAALIDARPAFSIVFDACCRRDHAKHRFRDMREVCIGQMNDFLEARLPRMPAHERRSVAVLVVTIAHGAYQTLHRVPHGSRVGMLQELQVMMMRYAAPLDARYGTPTAPHAVP